MFQTLTPFQFQSTWIQKFTRSNGGDDVLLKRYLVFLSFISAQRLFTHYVCECCFLFVIQLCAVVVVVAGIMGSSAQCFAFENRFSCLLLLVYPFISEGMLICFSSVVCVCLCVFFFLQLLRIRFCYFAQVDNNTRRQHSQYDTQNYLYSLFS